MGFWGVCACCAFVGKFHRERERERRGEREGKELTIFHLRPTNIISLARAVLLAGDRCS